MHIFQTPTFAKQLKKLYKNQKADLDKAVKIIVGDPAVGEGKKGDLSGVRVYKFKMTNQLTLLAYTCDVDESSLVLLALGSHENFYRTLKH